MASATVGILRVLLTGNSAEFETAIKKASDSVKTFKKDLDTIGRQATDVGSALTRTLTLPLAGLAAAAVKTGMQFEGVMNQIQGVLRPTAAQMEAVEKAAMEMGASTVFSATEAAEAMLELGKAGFTTEQALAGVGDVLNLAAASGMSMGDAASMAARTMNAFGLEVKDLGHINDVLAKSVNTSSLEIQDLQVAFGYIGPIAQGFGMSIEQAAAALGIMRDSGIAAETAGRALREGMSRLANPVTAVTEVMEKLGIDSFETNGQLMGLSEIVAILREKGLTAADSLKLFGDAAGPGMFALVQEGSTALDNLTAQLKDSGGAAKAMGDAMMAGLPGAMEKMKGSIETALLAINKAIEPIVITMAGWVEQLADLITSTIVPAFMALPSPVQTAALALTALAAAAGPVLFVFGQLASSVSAITALFTAKGLATRALTGLMPALAAGIRGVQTAVVSLTTAMRASAIGAVALQAALAGLAGLAVAGMIWGISEALNHLDRQIKEMEKRFETMAQASRLAERDIKDYAEAVRIVEAYQAGATGQQIKLTDAQGKSIKVTLDQMTAFRKGQEAGQGLRTEFGRITINADAARRSLEEGTRATNTQKAAVTSLTATLAATRREVAGLTADQKAQILAGDKMNMSAKEIADALKQVNAAAAVSEAAIKLYLEQVAASEKTQDTAAASAKKFAESVRTLSGAWEPYKRATDEGTEALRNLANGFNADGTIIVSTQEEIAEASRANDKAMQDWIARGGVFAKTVPMVSTQLVDAKEKTTKWTDALGSLAQSFGNLAQTAPGALGEVADTIARVFASMDAGAKAGKMFTDGFVEMLKTGAKDIGKGIAGLAAGLVGGIGAVAGATSGTELWQNVLGGGLTGAQYGSAIGAAIGGAMATSATQGLMIGGIWGAAAGAIVGIIIGVFRGRSTRREMEQVGREWGVDVSAGMVASIQNTAQTQFRGNQEAARFFMLDEFIKSAGGLNQINFSEFVSKFRGVFVMLQRGLFSSAQAVHVLNENWDAFVKAGTDSSGRLDERLREIIRLQEHWGIQARAIGEYLQGQGTAAIEGFNATAAAMPAVWGEIGARVAAAQVNLENLKASSDGTAESLDKIKAAERELQAALALQSSEAARNTEQLADLGTIAVASFSAAIASGQSFAQAIATAGPGLLQLGKAYESLGLEIEDAGVEALVLQANLQQKNPQLIAGVNGLSQSFVALHNMGLLNVETFRAMERQGLQMYARVQGEVEALGGSSKDALLPMQDYLHQAAEQAELLGIPLDENLANLIDQSQQWGIWQDKAPSAMDQMTTAMGRLVDRMDHFISVLMGTADATGDIGDAGEDAAARIDRSFRNVIPTVRALGSAVDDVVQQHSPTGLEGIMAYAGYAADALREMASQGIKALQPLGALIAGAAGSTAALGAAFTRITQSNIGRQLSTIVGNLRGLQLQDLGDVISGARGMGSGLAGKATALARAVQLAGRPEGLSRDTLSLFHQLTDEIEGLGPDPVVYRRRWQEASDALREQLAFQLEDLQFARDAQIRELGPVPALYETQYNAAVAKAQKAYAKQQKSIDENQARELRELEATRETYGSTYDHVLSDLVDSFGDMRTEAKERYDEEIERLGPLPSEYRQIYEDALEQIETYYNRMEERANDKVDAELESIGPIPDEYDRVYGEAVKNLQDKYRAMVAAAAAAAKETVDAWAIVAEMFAQLTRINPNIVATVPGPPPAGGPGPTTPPGGTTTAPSTEIPIDEVVRQVDALFIARRGTIATAEERALMARYIGYGGESSVTRANFEQLMTAIRDYFDTGRVPQLATGGVVTLPTVALVGERGPEAVMPLDVLASRDAALVHAVALLRDDLSADRRALRRDLMTTLPTLVETAARHGAQTAGRRR